MEKILSGELKNIQKIFTILKFSIYFLHEDGAIGSHQIHVFKYRTKFQTFNDSADELSPNSWLLRRRPHLSMDSYDTLRLGSLMTASSS